MDTIDLKCFMSLQFFFIINFNAILLMQVLFVPRRLLLKKIIDSTFKITVIMHIYNNSIKKIHKFTQFFFVAIVTLKQI